MPTSRTRGQKVGALLFGARGAGSFVTAGAAGLRRAQEEFGVDVDARYCADPSPSTRIHALAGLARSGAGLIVVHGGQGDVPVARVAPDFPATTFAISQGGLVAPNVASYEVLLEQPAFLAGALAAEQSRTGAVGHVSGERVRPGLKGRAAFAAGAAHVRPQTRILTSFCGNQHDVALAERFAAGQIAGGADILFTMLGAGRDGVTAACRRFGAKQIGDGVDWTVAMPEVFVAAAVADVSWGPYQAVSDFAARRFVHGRRVTVGLERPELCRLALAPQTGREMCERIAALAALIVAGTLRIPEDWTGPDFAPAQTG